jgi:hypothetical protein
MNRMEWGEKLAKLIDILGTKDSANIDILGQKTRAMHPGRIAPNDYEWDIAISEKTEKVF